MNWWPMRGLTRRFTERRTYVSNLPVKPLPSLFRRSLFVYPIDLGNSNALNMDISALKTPHYNPHRVGIFFAATPRQADVLLLLGTPIAPLREALTATLHQVPRPFAAVWIPEEGPDEEGIYLTKAVEDAGGSLIATIVPYRGPEDILGVLRTAMNGRFAS